jgi:hypothetical protein
MTTLAISGTFSAVSKQGLQNLRGALIMTNIERLDEVIQEVVTRGFDIRLQIENNGHYEFSILGNNTDGTSIVRCESMGDVEGSSVPMRIMEELLILDGKI